MLSSIHVPGTSIAYSIDYSYFNIKTVSTLCTGTVVNVSFLIVQEWGFARSAGPVFLKAFIDSRAPSLNGKLFHGPMII